MDLTLGLNLIAIGIGGVVGAALLVMYMLSQRKKSTTLTRPRRRGNTGGRTPNPAPAPDPPLSEVPQVESEMPMNISGTPEVIVVREKAKEPTDNIGQFMWFWLVLGAELIPVALLAVMGLSIYVVAIFFGTFPLVGIVSGYIFKRYRTSVPAREFDAMLRKSNAIALHIGTDDKARLVGGRRGSTGRWHLPNMEITADAIRKAIFPFYGNVISIVHSVSDSQLNPEFLYYATVFNRNSEKIGEDGRTKLSTEIADTIQKMIDREKELVEMQKEVIRINNGETNLATVLDFRYRNILYPDGVKLDTETSDALTSYWSGLIANDGWRMNVELAELDRAFQITVEEKGFHIEYEKDLKNRIIGAHLVHDRVIDLHDFRNYLPTGGTAESAHLSSENARLAGQEETGVTQSKWMRWVLLLLTPVMVGAAIYMIILALNSLKP